MKKLLLLLLLVSSSTFAASVTLTWDYVASDVTLYGVTVFNVERKPEACVTPTGTGPGELAFAEIATVSSSLRTYVDSTVTQSLTYCYRVAATGSAGKSTYSNTATILVPIPFPVAPKSLLVK